MKISKKGTDKKKSLKIKIEKVCANIMNSPMLYIIISKFSLKKTAPKQPKMALTLKRPLEPVKRRRVRCNFFCDQPVPDQPIPDQHVPKQTRPHPTGSYPAHCHPNHCLLTHSCPTHPCRTYPQTTHS